ncbi:putative transposase, Ptta/En/Spm, plant [Senna tora]|uniref:Putative transposase, Ptta/En/Spm, plant n=1 Tax=Senna tora TaxID=362788 RepID=A0A834W648_9FABA|nr:putative transposase, Ptta/En/Spm, plant [Senna tora]
MCSPPLIPQPSSSASTGQPQEPVEELQHEVPTNPSQQQGRIDSTSVDSSAIIPRGRDPTDGKLWIQPCGQSFHPSVQPIRFIRKVITSKFEEPHHVWSQKNFKWLPQYEDRIKACWNFKADERFRGLMKEV